MEKFPPSRFGRRGYRDGRGRAAVRPAPGRAQACYQPVDLGSLTAELAGNFESLCQRAGLRLIVHCTALTPDEPAYVDPDIWEKIVLNLLSNAFKFTLQGEIEVRLEPTEGQALLTVRATGVGKMAARVVYTTFRQRQRRAALPVVIAFTSA